ncbi:MAG TPA: hypothetical protein VF669_15580 [Tepidisphaeraceae bacterium]|jgi:hypothetical protein
MALENYHCPTRPVTREDVLAILIDHLRLIDPFFIALYPLSFESNVHEARRCLENRSEFPHLLNNAFALKLSRQEWDKVLKPFKKRTLSDLCDFITPLATRRYIEPVTILGSESRKAGAFLAVREILQNNGVDVSNLRPSSPLEPYLRKFDKNVLPELIQLAPCTLPQIEAQVGTLGALWLTMGCCALISTLASCVGFKDLAVPFSIVWVSLFLICLIGNGLFPKTPRLGWIRTFRDLSGVLAEEFPTAGPGFQVITRPPHAAAL